MEGAARYAFRPALILVQGVALLLRQGGHEVVQIQPVIEAVVVGLVHEMHLSDSPGDVAALAEEMADRARVFGQGIVQNLRAVSVRIDAGHNRPARRHAHRRLAIHAVEAGGAARDLIDVRGQHLAAAIASGSFALVLIGANEQQVHGRGAGPQDERPGGSGGQKLAAVHVQPFNVDSQSPQGLRQWPAGMVTSL